jgi:hypothetical protein
MDRAAIIVELRRAIGKARVRSAADGVSTFIEDSISGKKQVIPTGWKLLDLMTKILRSEKVGLLVGGPGASKSLMVLQLIIFLLDRLFSAVVLELEEGKDFHLLRCLAQRAALPGMTDPEWIKGNPDMAREAVSEHRDFLDTMGRVIHCPDSQLTLDQIADWVEKKCKAGVQVIAVDPVTAARHTSRDIAEEDNTFLQRIKTAADTSGSSIIIVSHPIKAFCEPDLSAISGAAAYGRFMQTIVWLETTIGRQSKVATACGTVSAEHNRILHLMKSRNSYGQGFKLAYQFNSNDLTLSEVGLIVGQDKGKKENADE